MTAVTLTLLLLASCAPPAISGAGMAEGNRLYEEGRFAEAAAAYQALVDAGVEDGRLYYNLGNAHFKAGDLGRALLNYRRAERLLPRDPDVAANLQLARGQATDRLEDAEGDGLASLAERALMGWTTLDEAAAITLGLGLLSSGLVAAAILWPRGRRALRVAIVVAAVTLALGLLSTTVRLAEERVRPPAVVVAQEVDVRSGPGDDYLLEFSLHAGAEVRVIERRAGWARIVLPGDLQGWLPGEALEEIITRN